MEVGATGGGGGREREGEAGVRARRAVEQPGRARRPGGD